MSNGDRIVVVWDAPTRLFHWLTAVLMAAACATWRLNWMEWHSRAGTVLLALLIFRLLWGWFGSDTARFFHFIASPRASVRQPAHIFRREPDRQAGHNPAGGWMVLLLALLLGETLTGVYIDSNIANVGPLTEFTPAPIADAIEALYATFWNALLAAIALHIAAILAIRQLGMTAFHPTAPFSHRVGKVGFGATAEMPTEPPVPRLVQQFGRSSHCKR